MNKCKTLALKCAVALLMAAIWFNAPHVNGAERESVTEIDITYTGFDTEGFWNALDDLSQPYADVWEIDRIQRELREHEASITVKEIE